MKNHPESHKLFTLNNFHDQEIANECYEWLLSSLWCLTLTGTPGAGKTHLAIALGVEYERFIKPGAYTTFLKLTQFTAEIRNAQLEGKSEYRIVESYANDVDFLILDDLGFMENTQAQKDKINDLIDRRYSNRKKTVITTNLTSKGIQDVFSERTYRRICDQGVEMELIKTQ